MGMDIELGYLDIMERYRTLRQYAIPVPTDEMTEAFRMASRWHELVLEAKTKDLCLLKVKEQFRQVTRKQAADFHEHLKEMEISFKANGPGSPGIQLENGVDLLAEYQQRVQVSVHPECHLSSPFVALCSLSVSGRSTRSPMIPPTWQTPSVSR